MLKTHFCENCFMLKTRFCLNQSKGVQDYFLAKHLLLELKIRFLRDFFFKNRFLSKSVLKDFKVPLKVGRKAFHAKNTFLQKPLY